MIIRKTTKEIKRHVKSYGNNFSDDAKHWEMVLISTYWLFFIPVYTTEKILSTTL